MTIRYSIEKRIINDGEAVTYVAMMKAGESILAGACFGKSASAERQIAAWIEQYAWPNAPWTVEASVVRTERRLTVDC